MRNTGLSALDRRPATEMRGWAVGTLEEAGAYMVHGSLESILSLFDSVDH